MQSLLKTSVSVALLALFCAAPAVAADLGKGGRSSSDEPENAGLISWSGLYIGAQGGYLKTVVGDEDGAGGLAASGFVGGGRIGYDIARGRGLFGIFGEYNFSGASLELGGVTVAEKEDEWTVGARLGYIAAPRTLVYVLGGYTQADFSTPLFGGQSITLDGATLGGGVEIAMASNLTFGVEAKHTIYIDSQIDDYGISADDTAVLGVLRLKLNSGLFGN
jgi:outer membrane immunogenic protein